MAVDTTTTLSGMIQSNMDEAMLAPRIQPLFWPGGAAHEFLMVDDITMSDKGSSYFPRYGSVTAYDVIEGELFSTNQNLGVSGTTATPTEKQVLTWITTKALGSLAAPNTNRLQAEAQEHIRSHMEKMDTEIFEAFASLDEGASDTGNAITVSDVQGAIKTLRQAKAPAPYVGFLSEQMWTDLATESTSALADASKSNQVGAELWSTYTVRQFLGVTWYVTDLVYNDGTDAYGAILSNKALGVSIKRLPEASVLTPETSAEAKRRRSIAVDSVADWAVEVVNSDMGVHLQFDYD